MALFIRNINTIINTNIFLEYYWPTTNKWLI